MEDMYKLVAALQKPELYNHAVKAFKVIETHMHMILLTGVHAYKIKKPLSLGFNDFTTLAKRKYFCLLETKLNKRLAEKFYCGVVPISGSVEAPTLGPLLLEEEKALSVAVVSGDLIPELPPLTATDPFEYMIKMVEFDQANLLSKVIERKELSVEQVYELAWTIATFHDKTDVCLPELPYGSPDAIWKDVSDNFTALLSETKLPCIVRHHPQLQIMLAWAERQKVRLWDTLKERKVQGHIRSCHGDMHAGNIFMDQGKAVIFDCIEFNDALRYTDTVNDIAFTAMDLEERQEYELAHALVNEYFEYSQDYAGLTLLLFYKHYRAMVRLKVTAIRTCQLMSKLSEVEKKRVEEGGQTGDSNLVGSLQEMDRLLQLALSYTSSSLPTASSFSSSSPPLVASSSTSTSSSSATERQTKLFITSGPSGTGKSFHSKTVMLQQKAIRLRSDVTRKFLLQLPTHALLPSERKAEAYDSGFAETVYARLAVTAELLLQNGFDVIVDAACLKYTQRQLLLRVAQKMKAQFIILSFDYEEGECAKRMEKRKSDKDQSSDATIEVFRKQITAMDCIAEDELPYTIRIPLKGLDFGPVIEAAVAASAAAKSAAEVANTAISVAVDTAAAARSNVSGASTAEAVAAADVGIAAVKEANKLAAVASTANVTAVTAILAEAKPKPVKKKEQGYCCCIC